MRLDVPIKHTYCLMVHIFLLLPRLIFVLLHIVITRELVVKLTICWLNASYHFIVLTKRIIFGSHWLLRLVFWFDISGTNKDFWPRFLHFMSERWLLTRDDIVIIHIGKVVGLNNVCCRLPRIFKRHLPGRLIDFDVLFFNFVVLDYGRRLPQI